MINAKTTLPSRMFSLRRFIPNMLLIPLLLASTKPACPEVKEKESEFSSGGRLIIGSSHHPTSINPLLSLDTASMWIIDLVFNKLVRLSPKGEFEPDLAESWEISRDGLIYTFHLRKGVRFHDGKECTADDVQFTFEALSNPAYPSSIQTEYNLVEKWSVADRYTFRVTLKQPYAPFLETMMREILPRHVLAGKDMNSAEFNYRPVGTGPFRFVSWKEDAILLEANSDYYEGKPCLDQVMLKIYPSADRTWVAFMRQEIDLMFYLKAEDYEIVKTDPAYRVLPVTGRGYFVMSYNLKNPLFTDSNTRRALSYAIDRKGIIERITSGYGMPASGPFHPDSWAYDENIEPYPYSPDTALELFSRAGWWYDPDQGVLKKNGQKFRFKLLVDSRNDLLYQLALILRQQLQEIGVRIEICTFDDDALLEKTYLVPGTFDAFLFRAQTGLDPDQASSYWYSPEAGTMNDNFWSYANPEADKLFEHGRTTLNQEKRKEIYRKIHQILSDDQPAAFLFYPYEFNAVSSKFGGTDAFFTPYQQVYVIKDWYVKPQVSHGLHKPSGQEGR